jgi:hypothetical protein
MSIRGNHTPLAWGVNQAAFDISANYFQRLMQKAIFGEAM